ncbi:hypothetical protein CYMTET_53952 [Cymbomonas tetramitiformis]|uniref:Uncharacterized protein n=1 Tax=Cymbomonas tetramitiformis TaxID=36881 RepID=A0AAE0EPJ9_9CHLO|nr:hypothetical protein CYMTET_53952 [Cymbomonas tetramitiformis]
MGPPPFDDPPTFPGASFFYGLPSDAIASGLVDFGAPITYLSSTPSPSSFPDSASAFYGLDAHGAFYGAALVYGVEVLADRSVDSGATITDSMVTPSPTTTSPTSAGNDARSYQAAEASGSFYGFYGLNAIYGLNASPLFSHHSVASPTMPSPHSPRPPDLPLPAPSQPPPLYPLPPEPPIPLPVSPPSAPLSPYTVEVGVVSSAIRFSELDVEQFDDAAFNTSFRSNFSIQMAAAGQVHIDDVLISAIITGSTHVVSAVYFHPIDGGEGDHIALAEAFAHTVNDTPAIVFDSVEFQSFGNISSDNVSVAIITINATSAPSPPASAPPPPVAASPSTPPGPTDTSSRNSSFLNDTTFALILGFLCTVILTVVVFVLYTRSNLGRLIKPWTFRRRDSPSEFMMITLTDDRDDQFDDALYEVTMNPLSSHENTVQSSSTVTKGNRSISTSNMLADLLVTNPVFEENAVDIKMSLDDCRNYQPGNPVSKCSLPRAVPKQNQEYVLVQNPLMASSNKAEGDEVNATDSMRDSGTAEVTTKDEGTTEDPRKDQHNMEGAVKDQDVQDFINDEESW